MSFFNDNADLKFYVDKGIDWKPVVELTEYQFRAPDGFKTVEEAVEFYRDVLELVGDFVSNEIAPYSKEMDELGLDFVDGEPIYSDRHNAIFEGLKGLELHGMCLPRELGGMNCSIIVYFFVCEMLSRAEPSVMTHHGFHGGMAMAMLAYSLTEGTTEFTVDPPRITKTRFAKEIEEIRRGDAWGCMDITEAGAGSDMAALRSRAVQDDAGNWKLTGEKTFITSGQGKYHFVIARTEKVKDPNDPFAGLGGLSLFLVPAFAKDKDGKEKRVITVERLEEKLGHHSSATCVVTFDETPAYLIGKRGEGFKHMLMLMNNARVGVGFEALGLCEAAHRLAREYAAERQSMGKTIDRHEMIADYLEQMETDIQGIRALAVTSAIEVEMASKLELMLQFGLGDPGGDQQELKRAYRHHQSAARRLTPLLKYIGPEKAVQMSRRCIQILGGVGFTKEFGAEKLYRDSVVMPIYEGTSQIQSLMATKDTLSGIMKNPKAFVKRIAQARWRSVSARNPLERRLARLQSVSLSVQQHLITKTAAIKLRGLQGKPIASWPQAFLKDWDPKRDFSYALLHAERLTRLLVDEAICEILWEQSKKHPERLELFERYLERAEPRCRYLHDQITTTGQRLLDQLADAEEADEKAVG